MIDRSFGELADDFFGALERGDRAAVTALYHDDAVIWHNIDDHEACAADNLRALEAYFRIVPERRYEDVKRHPIADGLIQEHVFVGRTERGTAIRTPMCLVIRFRDGQISEVREYLDSAHRSAILGGSGSVCLS